MHKVRHDFKLFVRRKKSASVCDDADYLPVTGQLTRFKMQISYFFELDLVKCDVLCFSITSTATLHF